MAPAFDPERRETMYVFAGFNLRRVRWQQTRADLGLKVADFRALRTNIDDRDASNQ
jgi:hypothetical protein